VATLRTFGIKILSTEDIKLAQKTLGAKISAFMVEAVGGAQISVNGGDAARDRRKIFYCFFTFYVFLSVKNMI
jgi:hypothetical protein